MKKNTSPIIAFLGIYNKQNEPILVRHYLVEHLEKDLRAEDNTSISEKDQQTVKAARLLEVSNLKIQIAMLSYAALDIFDEKQKILTDA